MNKNVSRTLVGGIAAVLAVLAAGHAFAATAPAEPTATSGPLSLAQSPIFTSQSVPPTVMLDITKDHQLFYKAYNDYTDLDNNGTLDAAELTYNHAFNYYGYFDPFKCYTYSTGNQRYEPASINTTKYCNQGSSTGQWSGNFLNWVAMARVDVLRKVLYGGSRSTDTATDTTLERTFLPTEAHSWAKHYNGTDIAQLTPFTGIAITPISWTMNSTATTGKMAQTVSSTSASLTRPTSGTTITTVTTTSAHGLDVGTYVLIGGVTTSGYNGIWQVQTVPSATSFTLDIGSRPGSSGSGTVTGALFPVTVPAGGWVQNGDQLKAENGTTSSALLPVYQVYNSAGAKVNGLTAGTSGYLTFISEDQPTGIGSSATSWKFTNLSSTGVSFCNTTYAPSTQVSQTLSTATYPPLIRASKGNYALWSANERWQCYWAEEKNNSQASFSGGLRSNGNRAGVSGLISSAENPASGITGLTNTGPTGYSDYVARVQACASSALIGNENCKSYGASLKPVGLLQQYGEGTTPKIRFGLMTGSFTKNVSGGVLRKNIGSISDELNTDGTLSATAGIIKTMDRIRLYGYNYSDGTYIGQDGCTYQQIGIAPAGGSTAQGQPASEGNCSSWGNPIAEMVLESLRYLAGKSANSAFTYTDSGSKDNTLGLPLATWTDPLNSSNYCSPLNILVINASVSSYDNDQLTTINDINGSGSGTYSASGLTKIVGDGEGITGNSALVGSNGTTSDGVCSAKSNVDLGTANGICPEAPTLSGSYLGAGACYAAHTKRIRASAGGVSPIAEDTHSFKASTYGVALSTNVPRIAIPVGTSNIVLQPAYRLDLGSGKYGTGTIVDFRVISQTATSGQYYLNWEDSNQGGDYDQDVTGILSYQVSGSNVYITTQILAASTANPQGFGYVTSGSNHDGPHFHSGIYGFSFTDPTNITIYSGTANTNASGGCNNCNDDVAATRIARTAVYGVGTSTAITLKDPLYYMAKWGGFKDSNGADTSGNLVPDLQSEWDSIDNLTGTKNPDGQPDNYFYVTNPGALETSLQNAFEAALHSAAAAAVAASSTSLRNDAMIFQARFNSQDWSGDLLAYSIDSLGVINNTPLWSASTKLSATAPASRTILTYDPTAKDGAAFRWSSLTASQRALLQLSTETTTAQAQMRVDYLRGDTSNEGSGTTQFRTRSGGVLGDIVFSGPKYVAAPAGQYQTENLFIGAYNDSTYRSFIINNSARTKMVYVGANDGMLHGFRAPDIPSGSTPPATAGNEVLAYVPNAIFSKLRDLTSQSYTHEYFVDGSPQVADAYINGNWMTVLVGGLNAGGRGIYALDVTDPSSFSESTASSTVLWEFTKDNDADLGYTFGDPLIVKMNNGKWAAVFGNGYKKSGDPADGDGHAKLFILFIENGIDGTWNTGDYIKIDTGVGTTAGPDGLSGVNAIDFDGNGTVDYIYGGDLLGNVWKFDVTSSTASSWSVANSGSPLFIACTDTSVPCPLAKRQAITSKPEISFHPANLDTMVVYIGTGKYLENSDASTTQTQTVYGIWDTNDGTSAARSGMQTQTLSTYAELDALGVPTGKTLRTVTSNTVDWSGSPPNKRGWLEDLNISKERITGSPTLVNGTLFYNTFIPSPSPCDFGGGGWLMGVDYATGGLLTKPPFVGFTNTTAGLNIGAVLGGTVFIPGPTNGVGISNPLSGSDPTKPPTPTATPISGSVFSGSRISWRELVPE